MPGFTFSSTTQQLQLQNIVSIGLCVAPNLYSERSWHVAKNVAIIIIWEHLTKLLRKKEQDENGLIILDSAL